MPEVNDLHLHAHTVGELLLQHSSNQGCFSRCFSCGSGVKSELFNACLECRELSQDVKPADAKAAPPQLVEPAYWRAAGPIAPAPIAAENHVPVPFAPPRVTRRSSSSEDSSRDHVARPRSPRRSVTSPYRTFHSQRGRPPNGSRQGPPGFKGVRQRKGVRGFLVEIRPPKWKRTIWLGTYNSDREAAGAYDAGIFYTHKKTKYNFPHLEGTFPPLPEKLRLDNADDSEEIKTFVQKEARAAAAKVKALSPAEGSATSSVATRHVGATSASSSECSTEPRDDVSPLVIPPLDEESLDEAWLQFEFSRGFHDIQAAFLDDLSNVSYQQPQPSVGWGMGVFELKQEIALDHDGLL